eukprot:TRINITY_DN2281_c0_g1_i1.p1 TRINITY_DN2281_c0_g1~~TRINITY_DN2281_c0_g1_i1.p1  ORF type:complete len:376 (-),score=104.95 TRINITY_DN2281_c0_g1_i1:109-1236(-)
MSLIAVTDTEWRTRKIKLMEVFRSFISQLSPGQDLTKIALPTVLCHPFSMLELVALRELQTFNALTAINNYDDPLERMLQVTRWYMTMVRDEVMEKKPFNPVIGETHMSFVHNGGDNYTEFIAEQVSHHPPVTAFVVRNRTEEVELESNVSFKVTFGKNCANVVTAGPATIRTRSDTYIMDQVVPNMVIRNVVWGKKYIMWEGKVSIRCPESGYSVNIAVKEKKKKNVIKGEILLDDEVVFLISGKCGDITYYAPVDDPKNKSEFFDISNWDQAVLQYADEEHYQQFDSLNVWTKVKNAIIENDMKVADEEKKLIEKEQRERIKQMTEEELNNGQFFVKSEEGVWEFQNNITLDHLWNDDEFETMSSFSDSSEES